MYYSYHNSIKKLLKEGQLVGWEFVEKYNNISPALVIYFSCHRPMPVREKHFEYYKKTLPCYLNCDKDKSNNENSGAIYVDDE